MATYRVTPLSDGESQRYGWQVQLGRRQLSTHYKKSGAIRAAKRTAGARDRIVIHRLDGTVQRSIGG